MQASRLVILLEVWYSKIILIMIVAIYWEAASHCLHGSFTHVAGHIFKTICGTAAITVVGYSAVDFVAALTEDAGRMIPSRGVGLRVARW